MIKYKIKQGGNGNIYLQIIEQSPWFSRLHGKKFGSIEVHSASYPEFIRHNIIDYSTGTLCIRGAVKEEDFRPVLVPIDWIYRITQTFELLNEEYKSDKV